MSTSWAGQLQVQDWRGGEWGDGGEGGVEGKGVELETHSSTLTVLVDLVCLLKDQNLHPSPQNAVCH